MFETFYNLSASPFRLNPDARFFFDSRSHKKAVSYLHYGLEQAEGFIVITGNVGSGKSTLVSHLLERLDHSRVVAAQIATTQIDADDVVRMIVSAFHLQPHSPDKATLLRTLEHFLLEQRRLGRHVLLVVDEAQNLPARTIEEIRMLSNLSQDSRSLFQIFLLGQPQFSALLANPNLEQLRQRVIASYHLETMSAAETRRYIEHRLTLVGWANDPAITDRAFQRIHQETGGLPRRINTLCSRLLLYGALEEIHALDQPEVEAVIDDLRHEIAESVMHSPALGAAGPSAPNVDRYAAAAAGETGGRSAASPAGAAALDAISRRVRSLEAMIDRHDRLLRLLIANMADSNEGRPLNRVDGQADYEPKGSDDVMRS